jgi:hypothetical protein
LTDSAQIQSRPESEPIHIDSPQYQGPDRREDSALHCVCHPKHTRILTDHDEALKALRVDLTRRREILDQRIAEEDKKLWEETKALERGKVSNKLFYIFVCVYSVLFISGIVTVYQGMHSNAINFLGGINDLRTEQAEKLTKIESSIKVLEYQANTNSRAMDKMETQIGKMSDLIKNGNNHQSK